LRTVLGILLVVNGYVLIYYRLLVRHFYEELHGVKESTFGSLVSFLPIAGCPNWARNMRAATGWPWRCWSACCW